MNFEGQNISLKDALFVDNITGDIENFRVRSSSIARVLVFPPVNNYHRFLIHKVVETGFPQFTTFSVGEGLDRRTVVCFQQHLIDYTLKQAQEFVPVPREYQNDIIELKQTPAESNTIETLKNNLDPITQLNTNVPPDDESTDNSQLVSENEPVVKLLKEKKKVSEVESDATLNSEKNLFSSAEITPEPEPEIALKPETGLKPEIVPKLETALEPEAALKPETDLKAKIAPKPETALEPELMVLDEDTSGMPIKAGNELDLEDTKKPIPKEPEEGQSQSDVTNSTEMNNGSPKEDKGESLSEKKGCRSKRPAIAVYVPPRARNSPSCSPGSAVLSVIKSSPTHPAVPVPAQNPSVNDDKGNTDVLDVTEQVVSEITVAVGGVQIESPEVDYLTFQTSDSTINIDQFGHVIELYDFPSEYKTTDLVNAFEAFTSRWDIKWVDDTHALGVFSSPEVAAEALSVRHPTILTRPLNMATPQSKSKARSVLEELLPYKPRPVSCTATARRLLQGALGSAMRVPDASKLENERLLEARRRKDEVRRRVGDAPEERKKRREVEIKPYVEKKHRYAEHDDR